MILVSVDHQINTDSSKARLVLEGDPETINRFKNVFYATANLAYDIDFVMKNHKEEEEA